MIAGGTGQKWSDLMTMFILFLVFCYWCHKLISYAKENPTRMIEWGQVVRRLFSK